MSPSDQPRGGLTRRRFIIGGAAAAAGLLAPRGVAAALGSAAATPPPALDALPVLSLGYVEGSRGATGLADLHGSHRVIPAESLAAGSRSLSGSAVRVAVAGLTTGAAEAIVAAGRTVRSVEFDVGVPLDAGRIAVSYVWSARSAAGTRSAPTAFTMVGGSRPATTWDLTVATVEGSSTLRRATPVTGSLAGMPKLTPGVYLAGLGPSTWSKPTALPSPSDPAWADLSSVVLVVGGPST